MIKIRMEPEGKSRGSIPTEFELSAIAALLAKGKEKPEDKLEAAWDLFNEAAALILRQEEDFCDTIADWRVQEAERERAWRLRTTCVLFHPQKDWDPARQYLDDKGYRLKSSKTFIRNLKPLFIRNRDKDSDEDQIVDTFQRGIKQGKLHVPKEYLDELARIKKMKKSEGGRKSHKTRRQKAGEK